MGLIVGLVALGGVFLLSLRCLPYRMAVPAQPWPWYCSDPAYGLLGYLAFPVNVLTNDLAQAARYAPLSLLIYALVGALIGLAVAASRSSPEG
jgi:hypothetical protein